MFERGEQDIRPGAKESKFLALVIVNSMVYNVLWRYLAISAPLALAVSAMVVFLPGYWFPPRPRVSFLKCAVVLELMIAAVVASLWPIPSLLRQFLPIQLAISIPSLLLGIPLFFLIGRLNPYYRGRVSFVKWLIGCLIWTLALVLAVTFLPEAR